jgi:hypothetical protein
LFQAREISADQANVLHTTSLITTNGDISLSGKVNNFLALTPQSLQVNTLN